MNRPPKLEPKDMPEPTREQMALFLKMFLEGGSSLMQMGDMVQEDLQPFTCMQCPLEAKTRESYNEIWNDPSEAHYICPILGKEVWGERPQCGAFGYKVLTKALTLVKRALDDKQQEVPLVQL